MVRRKITWIAEIEEHPQEFVKKKDAVLAEEEYNIDNEIKKLNGIFRKYFKTDYDDNHRYDSYVYFCVDCGIKLLEYAVEYDGHRNERGNVIYKHDGPAPKFFDGNRCEPCDKKVFKLFQEMLGSYIFSRNKEILIDIRDWYNTSRKNKKILLQIMKIVELWDKNH